MCNSNPVINLCLVKTVISQDIPKEFINPPLEFSVMPFWFWNDTLKDEEIIRQIVDFEAHGVYGFVIHPRIGLPSDMEWLSPQMIHAMDVAISEAARRDMDVSMRECILPVHQADRSSHAIRNMRHGDG